MTNREWLLAALAYTYADAAAVAVEARAIQGALERNFVTADVAAAWALAEGIIAPLPVTLDYWAEAAVAYRRDRYGAGGLLEQEAA
jgi:hypothetical protein